MLELGNLPMFWPSDSGQEERTKVALSPCGSNVLILRKIGPETATSEDILALHAAAITV